MATYSTTARTRGHQIILFQGAVDPIDSETTTHTLRTIYYLGMFGGFALATVILVYKPDTRYVTSHSAYHAPLHDCLASLPLVESNSDSHLLERLDADLFFPLSRYSTLPLPTPPALAIDATPIATHSIQTWALEEAKKRMEARGDKVEYKPSSSQ